MASPSCLLHGCLFCCAGQLLRVLPPLLYGMTFVNLWVKLQLPHCALLHWAASSAFTLGLQVRGLCFGFGL